MIGDELNMEKSNAVVKVDTEENWAKAKNYIPDKFTIIIYEAEDGKPPRIKIGDGIHTVGELSFLANKEVKDKTLIL